MNTRLLIGILLAFVTTGCSVARKMAMNQVASALSSGQGTFSQDDDLQLVRDAAPFGLKLNETILAETPRHRDLLTATAGNFTQYAFAFVQQDAEEMEERDLAAATVLYDRARRLYLRARGYGLRALEVKHRGLEKDLREDPVAAVKKITSKKEAPMLYWTAAAWGAAISISKSDPDLIADQPIVEALIDRALALDEKLENGAIHGFLISYEPSRIGQSAGAPERSRKHMERAIELSGGQLASPFVSFAESICVPGEDREEFQSLLQRALAIDVNARPEWKLENLVMQRRAKWLLAKTDRLFLSAH